MSEAGWLEEKVRAFQQLLGFSQRRFQGLHRTFRNTGHRLKKRRGGEGRSGERRRGGEGRSGEKWREEEKRGGDKRRGEERRGEEGRSGEKRRGVSHVDPGPPGSH